MTYRERIKAWANIARKIIANPKQKYLCPEKKNYVEFTISSFPKYNKIEIRMICEGMDKHVVIMMDIETID